jgi:2-polyprenyl-3-methyl-5-hydroxy-6-metoxy-1,4-benzoquinol methylase
MKTKNYAITEGYVIREENEYFDDMPLKDEYQNEVYQKAKELALSFGYRSILDIGCGSGYKLLKYFTGYDIAGVDLQPTVDNLNETYPEQKWIVFDEHDSPQGYDMVICSDVIEHIVDPDILLDYIKNCNSKMILISTPDRSLLPHPGGYLGPPNNRHHVREWTMSELNEYVSQHFKVVTHYISNESQATQLIIVMPK